MDVNEPEDNLDRIIIQETERLSEKSALREPLHVVTKKNWLVLFTILFIFLILLIWSFVERIPTEVTGRGISLSSGGVTLVRAKVGGYVSNVLVDLNQKVTQNDPLAKMYNSNIGALLIAIEESKKTIAKLKIELSLLCHALEINEELVKEGLIAQTIYYQSKATVLDKQIAISSAVATLAAQFDGLEKASFLLPEEFAKVKKTILEGPINDTEKMADFLSTIYSPSDGKILEIPIDKGEQISEKDLLFWIERPEVSDLGEVFYCTISGEITGRMRLGMRVYIEPFSVEKQEYGMIKGEVIEIHTYPSSKEELLNKIGNSQIVNYLIQDNNLRLFVVQPELSKDTVSGYGWTSEHGPPYKIPTGTLCKVHAVIEEQPPISYLIPIWKIKQM